MIFYFKEKSHIEYALRSEGKTAANTLNSSIALSMLEEDYSQMTPMVYSLIDQPHIQYVIVRDKNGKIVNQKGEKINEDKLLIESVPLEYFNETLGEIEIALRTDVMNKQLNSLVQFTFFISIIISILAMIVTLILSKKISSPLVNLMKASLCMIEGKRDVRVKVTGTNETIALSKAFNKMAEKIESNEIHLENEIFKTTKSLSEKIKILETNGNIARSVLKNEIDFHEVVFVILKELKSFTGMEHVSVTIIQSDKLSQEHLIVYLLTSNQLQKLEYPYSKYEEFYKKINQQEIYIQTNNDPSNNGLPLEIFNNKNVQSFMMIPLIIQERLIGTLNLGCEKERTFDEKLLTDLSILINQIVVVLDLVSAYESLHQAAYQDFNTGLYNYRYLKETLVKTINNKKKNNDSTTLAVLFLDLDRFKKINDTLGHGFGDLVLKKVGKIMEECIKDEGTVARIGGDEFVILLPNIRDGKAAIRTARKINNAINKPITIDGYEVHITSSIGIAIYPKDGEDAETLIKHADSAFYRIKEIGGNNISVYSPIEEDATYDQLVFENDLRKALERNEFSVYYQPKVNIKTGTITGLEALVRWIHPEKGPISPEKFIPIAEETGLIIPIGYYVLKTACKQIVEWQKKGLPPLSVSVNLSTKQFMKSDLVDMIKQIIYETGVEPTLLELEITESMTIDIKHAITVLNDLKSLGITISVDDFGTGYSSLNYLNMLPIDRLKIDRTFIKDITKNEENRAIVQTIIHIANNLNLKVIAEGVELEEQAMILKENNCDEIQGYFFSHPLSADEFEKNFDEINNRVIQWVKIAI